MRHQKRGRKLSRKKAHRNHLMRNLLTQILLHGRITTTLAKAKTVQPLIEKVIARNLKFKTKMDSHRYLDKLLYSKEAMTNLQNKFNPELKKYTSGFTKLIKIKNRPGDNCPMAILDLRVDEVNKSYFIAQKKQKAKDKDTKNKKVEPDKNKGSFWDRFKKTDKRSKKVKRKNQIQSKELAEKESIQRTTSK